MTRGREKDGGMPSQRQLRVGEAARHAIAELLSRGELHDPRLDGTSITVSEVRMSRDLRQARVYVAELGRDIRPEILNALRTAAPRLGGRLARLLHLKYAPVVRFEVDSTFAEAERIERTLADALGNAFDSRGPHGTP